MFRAVPPEAEALIADEPRMATVVRDIEERRAAAEWINPKYDADASTWPENTLVRIEIGSCSYRTYP